MDISIVVFAGIIVSGIFALPIAVRSIQKLLKTFFDYKNKQEQKQQEQKIEQTKDELKETINNGNLSDLFDIADKLGNDKEKHQQGKQQ